MDAARPATPSTGSSGFRRPGGRALGKRIFGGLLLIAAEEARSGAGGQHAQMMPRADAQRAPPRPPARGRQIERMTGG